MHDTKFYRMGKLIYRLRWAIIGLWTVIILSCIPFLPNIVSPFNSTGFVDEQSKSEQTSRKLDKNLGYNNNNKFIIIYSSKHLLATSTAFKDKINKSLAKLKKLPEHYEIILPGDNKKQISKDKHTSYVMVIIKNTKPVNDKLLAQFKSLIRAPPQMTMQLGGQSIFVDDVNKQTQKDLYKADFIATPVSIIVLLIVFGSLISAVIPIILGGGCALVILTTLYFIGHAVSLSIFTLNIALLLGLCLSLDYSLFIISRFREELNQGKPAIEAVAATQATAGKAIFFSGLAVFVSLSALFLFPVNILFSIAVGGLAAVLIAMLMAIILLPAILSVLNTRINSFPVRLFKNNNHSNFWHRLAKQVVKFPHLFFIFIFFFLLMLGYPFLSAKFGLSDFRILPEHSKPRHFYSTWSQKFDEKELNAIVLVVQTRSSITSRHNISKLYDLTHQLKRNPSIKQVNSMVTLNPDLTKDQYFKLYHLPENLIDKNIKQMLAHSTGKLFTVITVVSKYPINSPEMRTLITTLRQTKTSPGMTMHLTGTPVSNMELLDTISHQLPYAILWIGVFTYLILLLLLRSIFLPIKAILMNIISLCACYGALVLVFQDGYLHQIINFEPQGMLDISLLVIIFCALFGFSMDYEVFLLTRIKESWDATHDNEKSIIYGIEKSNRIIFNAAIIVITLCVTFLVADILMVKAFGLGIAVAIFVDAFIIRTVLVPATMTLLKKWNWYLPKWLDRILPRL